MKKILLTIAFGIISFLLISCSDNPVKYVENCADDKFIIFLETKIEVRESDLKKPQKEIIWTCPNWESTLPYICPEAYNPEDVFTIINCNCSNAESIQKEARESLPIYKEQLALLKKLPLSEKLKSYYRYPKNLGLYWHENYEAVFKGCSAEMMEDELTFKSKWN